MLPINNGPIQRILCLIQAAHIISVITRNRPVLQLVRKFFSAISGPVHSRRRAIGYFPRLQVHRLCICRHSTSTQAAHGVDGASTLARELCDLPDPFGALRHGVVELGELLGLRLELRVGVAYGLGDLIGFSLSCFHDLTSGIDGVRGALNALRYPPEPL